MQNACPYGFGKVLDLDFDRALEKLLGLFAERGFRILFQIDMKENMRRELDVEFRRYMIVGACHPALANQAFSADLNIGLLLPCNVIVYEEEGGRSRVMAMDPAYIMDMVRVPKAIEVAIEVKEQLEGIIEQM